MKVDKELFPMKGHFFLFNAGTAPLVPYLSTYAKQLGYTSDIVGIIYTVLPITGLIAKPLFGAIADRYRAQKTLFILFQILTAVTFLGIYFIPEEPINVRVQIDCGEGEAFVKSCARQGMDISDCSVYQIISENTTTQCEITCDMTSIGMWQTVCEHWHIPTYCYSAANSIDFKSTIETDKTVLRDNCTLLHTHLVELDGRSYNPRCYPTGELVNATESCTLKCPKDREFNSSMSCLDDGSHFKICNETMEAMGYFDKNVNVTCNTSCSVDKWRLMEICDGWMADEAESCQPKTLHGEEFPDYLSFTGLVPLSYTLPMNECVFFKLQKILLADGSVHYPNCPSILNHTEFKPRCTISCDNIQVNELLRSMAAESNQHAGLLQMSDRFWLFFLLMMASWVGQAVVVSIADAICFDMLANKPSGYGRQRLWGSVGWGVFSLLTGVLIDEFSRGSATKDYTCAFVLMFAFLSLDVVVSYTLNYKASKMSINILQDVGSLLSSSHTLVFLAWTIGVGVCTGLLWNFLFWHLEDVSCTSVAYIKTLQGLVSAIQCYGGEIPFMYLSGPILKRFGHKNTMSAVLLAFGVRFMLYSWLSNPWWVLPIELLQGVTYGMFYPTMTSYASVVAPPGTEATVQGLVGAIFEGIGTSLGSFLGGAIYRRHGGGQTFFAFGCGALVLCCLHVIAQLLLTKYRGEGVVVREEYSTIIRYAPPGDAIHILEEDNERN